MPKNIVVFCDGTGNQYGDRNSNVVKLYSLLVEDPQRQILFYDPGVGTISSHRALAFVRKWTARIIGLAFGVGLTKNIADAYRFLMSTYEEGDHVFIFGFSRGAYTARAVAGMLHKVGLLHKHNDNLLNYALRVYKREKSYKIFKGFSKTFCRKCPIHFLGLWDTVSSVGWVWDPLILWHTATNPSVANVRHAVSIDERRAFFRQNLWRGSEGDVKQVWFAGVHSDVGGSYKYAESGLANTALEWITVEAEKKDLLVRRADAFQAFQSKHVPDHLGKKHSSLKPWWWPLELFPKLYYRGKKKNGNDKLRGIGLNLWRRRIMPRNAVIHQSAEMRMEEDEAYSPSNVPKSYATEPWIRYADTYREAKAQVQKTDPRVIG